MKLFPERFLTTSQNLYDPLRPSKTPQKKQSWPSDLPMHLETLPDHPLDLLFFFFLLDFPFFFYFFCLTSLFLQESVESLGLMVGARLLCFFPLIGQLSANPSKCPILSFQLSANPSKCSIVQFNFFSEMAFLQF